MSRTSGSERDPDCRSKQPRVNDETTVRATAALQRRVRRLIDGDTALSTSAP